MSDDKLAQIKKKLEKQGQPATPKLRIHKNATISMSVGELKAAIESNSEHPVAVSFLKGIGKRPDTTKLAVEAVDLQALIENKEVITYETEEDSFIVCRKTLGRSLSQVPMPAPQPESPPPIVDEQYQPAEPGQIDLDE